MSEMQSESNRQETWALLTQGVNPDSCSSRLLKGRGSARTLRTLERLFDKKRAELFRSQPEISFSNRKPGPHKRWNTAALRSFKSWLRMPEGHYGTPEAPTLDTDASAERAGCDKATILNNLRDKAIPDWSREVPVQAVEYPRMKRTLVLLHARQEVRSMLDISGFGPSASGRLCFALLICLVLFGISLIVSFATHQSPPLAIAQAMTIIVAGFIPFMMLVLGPADEELTKQYDLIVASLPEAKEAWIEHKKQVASERLRQKQERAEREELEQEEEEQRERALQRAEERLMRQGTNLAVSPQVNLSVSQTVVFALPTKSVGLAFLLAFLFGPLGMVYSTVAGGLIMLMVSPIVACATAGLGLLITWPICILWAMVAASSYNNKLMRGRRW